MVDRNKRLFDLLLIAMAGLILVLLCARPIPNGHWYAIASVILTISTMTVLSITTLISFRLYGWKALEGKVWFFITMAVLVMIPGLLIEGTLVVSTVLAAPTYIMLFIALHYKLRFVLPIVPKLAVLIAIGTGLVVLISVYYSQFILTQDQVVVHEPLWIMVVAPLFDAALVAVATIIAVYCGGFISTTWYIIACGVMLIACADIIFNYMIIRGLYAYGHPIDALWLIAFLLITYGAHQLRTRQLESVWA